MNGESALRHPLVTRYLTELDHLLAGLHPAERAEVLTGVGEHLEESLAGSGGSDVAVRSALDELGPAAAVADAAYDGRERVVQPPPGTYATVPPRVVPATSRSWVPSLVVVLEALALLLATGVLFATIEGTGYVEMLIFVLLSSFPVWIPAVVLALVSALWTGGEKTVLVALVPAYGVGVPFVIDLVPFETGPAERLILFAIVALTVCVLLILLTRRAVRRARALVT